jgi:hypothetical protein
MLTTIASCSESGFDLVRQLHARRAVSKMRQVQRIADAQISEIDFDEFRQVLGASRRSSMSISARLTMPPCCLTPRASALH